MISVIILDDHLMVLKGLQTMLENEKDIHVSHIFEHATNLLYHLKSEICDVLLLDINLQDANGIDLCKEITTHYPTISIIAISNYSESGFIKNMMRNGAKSYLLKNTTREELTETIKKVRLKNTYLPRKIQDILINDSLGKQSSTNFVPKLTRREKEILECIGNELTNNEIAETLFISIKTVEGHRNNLLQKLGARNTAGLIKEAFKKGLLS